MLPHLGKMLIILGVVLLVVGIILLFADRIPFLGKLPGDLTFRGKNTTVYIPLATMLLISIILTILLNIFGRDR
jgi:hypothetical protein